MKTKNFNPNVPIVGQVSNQPDRVEDEQLNALIAHWMCDKTKVQSIYFYYKSNQFDYHYHIFFIKLFYVFFNSLRRLVKRTDKHVLI